MDVFLLFFSHRAESSNLDVFFGLQNNRLAMLLVMPNIHHRKHTEAKGKTQRQRMEDAETQRGQRLQKTM